MEEPEAVRYMFIEQDGVPRVGPLTLAEYAKVLFSAEAYEKAWALFLYGTEEIPDTPQTRRRIAWVEAVLKTSREKHAL